MVGEVNVNNVIIMMPNIERWCSRLGEIDRWSQNVFKWRSCYREQIGTSGRYDQEKEDEGELSIAKKCIIFSFHYELLFGKTI
jgi:hypothetical protein